MLRIECGRSSTLFHLNMAPHSYHFVTAPRFWMHGDCLLQRPPNSAAFSISNFRAGRAPHRESQYPGSGFATTAGGSGC